MKNMKKHKERWCPENLYWLKYLPMINVHEEVHRLLQFIHLS